MTRYPRRYLVALLTLGLLFATFTPAHAQSCTWGDIICEMQQAMQQLLDPLKDWAELKANVLFYGTLYTLIHDAAEFFWGPWKALYGLGVVVGAMAEWVGLNVFQPMIQATNTMTAAMLSTVFFVALVVLGCTYILSAVVRLRVVNPRQAIMWLLAISLFYQLGPGLFAGFFEFRRALNAYLLGAASQALQGTDPFGQLAGDDPDKVGMSSMFPPCHNFTAYLPGTAGTAVNGLDIALAYLRADGYDVLNGGTPCGLGTGLPTDLPRAWYGPEGYFDLLLAPPTWEQPGLPAEQAIARIRAAAQAAFASLTRLLNALPLILFGIVEQIIALCLVVAVGLTFVSFSVAALFAFFERTEPMAWAVLDQWLSLLVQMVVIGLMQAVCLALYLSVAQHPTPSPLITVAVSWLGLFIFAILLMSAVKSIWNAFNRLFDAVGRATGARVTPGEMAGVAVNAGMAVATGGASLVGAAAGGVHALSQGATWAQSAGVALGDNRALDGAAWQLARLPGVRHTVVGEVAEQFLEGAAAGRAGGALLDVAPSGGLLRRLGGATLGTAFLTNRNAADEEAYLDEQGRVYWQAPLLQRGMAERVAGLATSPRWETDEQPRIGRGGTPLNDGDGTPLRRRDVAVNSTPTRPTRVTTSAADTDLDEQLRDDLREARDTSPHSSPNRGHEAASMRLEQAATTLAGAASHAGDRLGHAADATHAATAQRTLDKVEGTVNVAGTEAVAALLATALGSLRGQEGTSGHPPTSGSVSRALLGAAGLTPSDAQPLDPQARRALPFMAQATAMHLDGEDAARVLREVKHNPTGELSPATRGTLVRHQREAGQAWQPSLAAVTHLEHAARHVPDHFTLHGAQPASQPVQTVIHTVTLEALRSRLTAHPTREDK